MIGIDIRELSNLKLLQPVCEYFIKHNIQYNVYYYDMPRASKEYNRASAANINASNPSILSKAKKSRPYNQNANLFGLLKNDGIRKFVSVELYLCYSDIINNLRSCGIKTYSLKYLTDGMWTAKKSSYELVDKTYFTSQWVMKQALRLAGAKYNAQSHLYLGSPLYDQLKNLGSKENMLVMLPNLTVDYVSAAFGSEQKFVKIIENLSANHNLIFKTRKKQWLPNSIKQYTNTIITDGSKMYPSSIVDAFNKCDKIVMFYSSGIYEAAATGKLVINIPLPLSRWHWDQTKLKEYFKSELYDYSGAVINVEQNDIITSPLEFGQVDEKANKEWTDKFIGNLDGLGAENIAKNILL